jgi:hypothetical protein
MFVLALIGSLLPLAAVAILFGLIISLPWHSFLTAPAFAGIVAIIIAVGNGIWQDFRQRNDRSQREKEKTQQMLQEKAEQYCLASRNLMTKCQDFGDAVEHGKDDLLMHLKQQIGELQNTVLLLEHFQLAFLKGTIEQTGEIASRLMKNIVYFVYLLGERKGADITYALKEGPVADAYATIEIRLLENIKTVTEVTDRIPNLDLYKLFIEWRKKHPIE